jgi:hypothetical protein
MQAGLCISGRVKLQKAEAGPTSAGSTRRLAHLEVGLQHARPRPEAGADGLQRHLEHLAVERRILYLAG